MKKFFLIFISIILLTIPVVYAEDFDTNVVSKGDNPSGGTSSLYKYWAYYKSTGTRYVIRVYDWNTEKFIAVPKEYYINHVYGYNSSGKVDTNKQVMYLGVDKTSNGKYTIVKSGSTIFTDNTYSHILKWYDNPSVTNFGLTKKDVNLLAEIVRDKARENGNMALEKSMQQVIDGVIPYEVRAEILFLMKMPGTGGEAQTGWVTGKGSMENYSFTFYNNKATSKTPSSQWRKDYITYLEAKAIGYKWGDDCGITMKAYWLDKIACALYEKDYEYVFTGNTYQCSCDLYRRRFGSDNVVYWLSNNKIHVNQSSTDPNDSSDRRYMYYTPGRCGIPVSIDNVTYYVTPGQTYNNLNGNTVTINRRIKYSNNKDGIESHTYDYLNVVSKDATKATIYEGWDYITNKLASTLVIAVDKDTGNIINLNNVMYSEYKSVSEGIYNKKAWLIDGYEYLGYITKDDFSSPKVPVGVVDTKDNVNVNISKTDVENGAKKQVIFVYERSKNNEAKEARLSIYKIANEGNLIMFTGKFYIDKNNNLSINLYDKDGNKKYVETINFDTQNGYIINTSVIENMLGLSKEQYKYVGNLIKIHPEYFLTYLNETLDSAEGDIYNLKNISEDKVHIILGYEVSSPIIEVEGDPELKISYIDDKGNIISGKEPIITTEEINKSITSAAEDLKEDMYMYLGYTYIDSKDDFMEVPTPLNIIGKENNVTTLFNNGDDRRHIAFVYKKIELKFEIDIIMRPDNLANQLIGQKVGEDYWVLDESGKVVLKVSVTGTEGLNILNYAVKLRIPFDTFMNGSYIPANMVNNLTVNNLSEIIVADKLIVPIWVKEGKYDIDAAIEANVEGFGVVTANKKDDVEVVGRLYDFTVTNLDGSDKTGDEKWKKTLFPDDNTEYKANVVPIGQKQDQPEKYNYGIKLGTTFYFSINTKGIKNDAISIVPKFIYVSEDGKTLKEVDIYFNENGKIKNILSEDLTERYMKLRDGNILKPNVIKEVERAQLISKILNRYNYSTSDNRNLGKLSNTIVCKYLSLPYLNYTNEFKDLYGINALNLSGKTEDEILTYASHWYGKYVVPSSSKVVDKGASANSTGYKDGYLIVCFKIISLDSEGKEYLSYNLPVNNTEWQKENLNQNISLPLIKKDDNENKKILIDTLKDGYAPTIIYQVGISIKDNNTSVGTH